MFNGIEGMPRAQIEAQGEERAQVARRQAAHNRIASQLELVGLNLPEPEVTLAFDYDLFTIGGGSGGVRASRVSASYGAKVAIAEDGRFGGTCVNVGCIPKKLFSYAAHFREDFEIARGYGWTVGEPRFDWPTLLKQQGPRDRAPERRVRERARQGRRRDPSRARRTCGTRTRSRWRARPTRRRHILVATGSWPVLPRDPRHRARDHLERGFALERLPRRAIVVGGGYIALEFASIFHGLGVETTLTYRGKRLLRGFDAEVGTRIAEEMAAKGVDICFGCEPGAIRKKAGHRNRIHRRQPRAHRPRDVRHRPAAEHRASSASSRRASSSRRWRGDGGSSTRNAA